MTDQHPLVAMYPGARVPAARVDTHAVRSAAGVLQVHVTRYPVDRPMMWQEPETLITHLMVVKPRPWSEVEPHIPPECAQETRRRLRIENSNLQRLAAEASVVVTRADQAPPMLALDAAMRQHLWAAVVGVLVDDRSMLVGLRTARDEGYAVTMTAATDPGPLSLYASAAYGWVRWWVSQASEVADRQVLVGELPPPPLELDVVEAWRPYRVRLELPERTSWPCRPRSASPPSWLDDPD